jgi:hypothetical protein
MKRGAEVLLAAATAFSAGSIVAGYEERQVEDLRLVECTMHDVAKGQTTTHLFPEKPILIGGWKGLGADLIRRPKTVELMLDGNINYDGVVLPTGEEVVFDSNDIEFRMSASRSVNGTMLAIDAECTKRGTEDTLL